jgi:hypothetical protein
MEVFLKKLLFGSGKLTKFFDSGRISLHVKKVKGTFWKPKNESTARKLVVLQ